eukprot:SAG31_NODE_2826_length_5035_cov_2.062601_2_plen_41_part_00
MKHLLLINLVPANRVRPYVRYVRTQVLNLVRRSEVLRMRY